MSLRLPSRPAALRRGRPVAVLASVLLVAAAALLIAGCGRVNKDTVIAKVGDHAITAGYYEERLSHLDAKDLPLDADGQVVDTATLEGRKAFLDVIINKELMARKARDLGYGEETNIADAAKTMAEFHAATALHKDLIEVKANAVTEQEVQDYYANLGTVRRCSFLITNFKDDALKARQELVDGALWPDVAQKYHDGAAPPDAKWQVAVPWGRFEDSFENAVFSLQEGEISQPVETVYGWWLLRLDNVEHVQSPPLDQIRDKVVDGIRMQKTNLARKAFMKEMHEKYGFVLDEGALWQLYQGLPEGEEILDPETKQPTPREKLKPLDLPLEQMDRVLYSYRLGDDEHKITLGDYKQAFDQANVFERPKRAEMLGGLRQKITEKVDRILIVEEARARGYMQSEQVVDTVDQKREEMMVNKLYNDLVTIQDYVSPADLETLWAEVGSQYALPERRAGLVVYCQDEQSAKDARAALQDGMEWGAMLKFYDTVPANQERGGQTEEFRADQVGPVRDALFGLEAPGEISDPFLADQKWALVRLETIQPARQRSLDEVSGELADRVRSRRREEKLQQLLDEWRQQYPVQVYEKKLAKLPSWDQLRAAGKAS